MTPSTIMTPARAEAAVALRRQRMTLIEIVARLNEMPGGEVDYDTLKIHFARHGVRLDRLVKWTPERVALLRELDGGPRDTIVARLCALPGPAIDWNSARHKASVLRMLAKAAARADTAPVPEVAVVRAPASVRTRDGMPSLAQIADIRAAVAVEGAVPETLPRVLRWGARNGLKGLGVAALNSQRQAQGLPPFRVVG